MIYLSAEHFLICASAFIFPPILAVVLSVIVLATFGKSLGLREKYISFLISVFEWGARQVKEKEESSKKNNNETYSSDGTYTSPGGPEMLQDPEREECIIHREVTIPLELGDGVERKVDCRGWAIIRDSTDFLKAGIEAIIEDEVTSRFKTEQLANWNMLTRTSVSFYHSANWKLTLLWALGFLIRYILLLPFRFLLFTIGFIFLVVCTAAIGVFPKGNMKRKLNEQCMLVCHRIVSRSFTALVRFHNPENKARSGGICVANHTSPIDVLFLGIDNVYALVGQRHTGFLGATQRALSRSSSHIWFERSETKDRALVTARLKEHVDDPTKLPILIFPEGTCINNTSVMMFKKGCFESGTIIYPIAMKYDPRFGDAFWNSSEQGWCEYLLRMMTSWAIICDVWYLPSMTRLPNESAVEFANRVKREIAIRGGLVDLEWDGGLKRAKVPVRMVAHQQQKYYQRISRYTSCSDSSGRPRLMTEKRKNTGNSDSDSSLHELDDLTEDVIVDGEAFQEPINDHKVQLASDQNMATTSLDSDEAFEDSQEDTENSFGDLNANPCTTTGGCDVTGPVGKEWCGSSGSPPVNERGSIQVDAT